MVVSGGMQQTKELKKKKDCFARARQSETSLKNEIKTLNPDRQILFIFCEHLTIGLKIILDKVSSTIPEDIEIQKERQQFIVDAMTDDARFVRWSNKDKPNDANSESKNSRGRVIARDQPGKKSRNRTSVTRRPSLAPSFRKRRNSKEPVQNFEVEKHT